MAAPSPTTPAEPAFALNSVPVMLFSAVMVTVPSAVMVPRISAWDVPFKIAMDTDPPAANTPPAAAPTTAFKFVFSLARITAFPVSVILVLLPILAVVALAASEVK